MRNVELVVIGALLICAPSLIQAFDGGIGPAAALVRLALALLVSWACVAIVERVLDTYSSEARKRALEVRINTLEEARRELVARAREANGPKAGDADSAGR